MPPAPALASSRRGAGQPGAAEVLDADDEVRGEDLQAALDEQLLRERVADLDARGACVGPASSKVSEASTDDAADAVAAGLGAEQDDQVARARTPWPAGCPRAASRRRTAR